MFSSIEYVQDRLKNRKYITNRRIATVCRLRADFFNLG